MGSGSIIRQYERRFRQGESIYEYPVSEEVCEEATTKIVKIFGEYEIRKTEGEEYELLKSGKDIGYFSKAFTDDNRVLFSLSHGALLEVSGKGCREIFTLEMAEICGLMASDGGLCHFGYRIHFTSKDKELIEYYNRLFKEVYGVEPHTYYREKKDGRTYFESRTYNKKIYFDMLSLNVKPKPYQFRVPFEHLDENGLRAYLRGFFSGDGDVSKNGKRFRIRISSSHREGLEDLWKACEILGFHPTPIRGDIDKKGHVRYSFEIPREECARFAEEIGSLRPSHSEKLKSIGLKLEKVGPNKGG